MKILITNLLLFIGLHQALARSLPWLTSIEDLSADYDVFHVPSNQPNDGFYNFVAEDSSEESEELEKLGGFLDTLLGSFLEMDDEEDIKNNESVSSESNERTAHNEDDDVSEELVNNVAAPENDSSEETTSSEMKNSKSNEDSDEVPSMVEVESSEETENDNEVKGRSVDNSNESTEITDMTNSSQEHTSDEVGDLSETDVNKLASFFIALDILSDIGAVMKTPEAEDDIVRGKEADEILELFGSVLDKMRDQQDQAKQAASSEKSHEKKVKSKTIRNVGAEEGNNGEPTKTAITTTTTVRADTNASGNDDDDDTKSNSNANDANFVYVVFQGADEHGEQSNLNDHKYSVINSQPELKPTSAPYMPENDSTSIRVTNAENSIKKYVEIRKKLDGQQDSLKKHQLELDKDFYAIVSNNFDDNTLDKFEKDIYTAQENLDNIKRNINAMQNLQTKLYFHKLVTAAIREAQNRPTNL